MISHILHPINQSAPCLKKRHTIGLLYLWHTSTDFDIFRQKCCRQSKQSKDALLRHLKQLVLLHYLAKRETRNVHFSLKCCITALPEFNQSLIGFFNLFDSRLILTLLHDSLNLVINAFSSGLLGAWLRRNEVEGTAEVGLCSLHNVPVCCLLSFLFCKLMQKH